MVISETLIKINFTDALMHSGMPGMYDIKTYLTKKLLQYILTFNFSSVRVITFSFVLTTVSKAIDYFIRIGYTL